MSSGKMLVLGLPTADLDFSYKKRSGKQFASVFSPSGFRVGNSSDIFETATSSSTSCSLL